MGRRLSGQVGALEVQHIEERRKQATELVVKDLQQKLADTEKGLADPQKWHFLSTRDANLVILGTPPHLREAPSDLFQSSEDDEFLRHDYDAAIGKLQLLITSGDPAIRAEALLRTARNLRHARRLDRALDA